MSIDSFKSLCGELLGALEDEYDAHWPGGADGDYLIDRARALLAEPEAVGPTDEELLATLNQAVADFPPRHPEAEAMNAVEYPLALELRKARAVLACWAHPAAAPVPVSERLPGPEDCDEQGRCWRYIDPEESMGNPMWELARSKYAGATYGSVAWLPANALPPPPYEVQP